MVMSKSQHTAQMDCLMGPWSVMYAMVNHVWSDLKGTYIG